MPHHRPVTPTEQQPCCAEMSALTSALTTDLSRRGVLRGGLLAAGATATVGSAVLTASPAAAASASSVLVVLSLRGAMDGLSVVVPHGDPVYYRARPRIAVPSSQLLAKDGFFGLHPGMKPLLGLWRSEELAFVHAAGLPAPNRSHFAAMEELEDAAPGSSLREGWLNRLVGRSSDVSSSDGVAFGPGAAPTSLAGRAPTLAAQALDDVSIAGPTWDASRARQRERGLRTMWKGEKGVLGRAMDETFTAVEELAPARRQRSRASAYPDGDLGAALADAARLIRADLGTEVITVDQGEWDMHTRLGTLEWGRMIRNVDELARAVAAFFGDLGSQRSKVTLVALSEFGRRVEENEDLGLDHGYGNVMMVAGAGVRGGRYLGRWPGLSLGADSDLLVTTDYRQVLGEVVQKRFSGTSVSEVFPGLRYDPVGVLKAA
ncbi:DUF1501 domain-containing protein [Nocardioides sp. GY 10127]|uniref:DUF1501 domain-containing protein n=1 Tax=Nocardioides sp. GY 10127 TaxID=2569762 RepID=UPI0010A9329A|nr:DUF1501 domain-containing protein [Nocardioides sp. GY 10127]TIC81568.1 DUF1501 domain-containing protein [Nocardioides sp. GY 10127]